MAIGIAALLLCWIFFELSLDIAFIVMIFETLFAAIALSWTVIVVIRMLKEPGEKKKKRKSPPPESPYPTTGTRPPREGETT